jgi:hypothetical protein
MRVAAGFSLRHYTQPKGCGYPARRSKKFLTTEHMEHTEILVTKAGRMKSF